VTTPRGTLLRFQFLGENFGRRLAASFGSAESFRTENWLCVARVVLALYCYAWIQLSASEFLLEPWRIHGLLNVFVIYSAVIFILLQVLGKADGTYQLTAAFVDLLFAGTLTLLTGGPESPYAVLFVFVVLSVACRWGLLDTEVAVAVCAGVVAFEALAVQRWPQYFESFGGPELRTERFLLRGAALVFLSLLFGALTAQERKLRARSELLSRVLGHANPEGRMELALETLFKEIVPLYEPSKALIALRKGNMEEVFYWDTTPNAHAPADAGAVKTVLQFSKLEAAAFSFPAHSWFLRKDLRYPRRASRLVAFETTGRRAGSFDRRELNAYLPAIQVPSLMVSSFALGTGCTGRVILIGPLVNADSRAALRFLQGVTRRIGPLLEEMNLLRDIRMHASDEVRARLTRELHDGTLQSLLSTEMQIEVLRRQRTGLSAELDRRLLALQTQVHQEALGLRDLIENTKPLNFGSKELPDFLAELVARFRRDTGISVRLETEEEEIHLPPGVCHEIVRIVQEGLSNIRKHSRAKNVVITLGQAADGQLKLAIADDGEGFGFRGRVTHTQLDASHRGPGVIKERVRLIGGELTIDSNPGHGARLEITIPDENHG
jgi:signal transduction histidine kinase